MSKFLKSDLVGPMGQLGTSTVIGDEGGDGGYTADEIANLAAPSGEIVLESATKIGDYSFRGRTKIVSVNSDTVTYLGQYSFQNCTNLVAVHLPKVTNNSVSSTFAGCTKLEKIGANDLKLIDTLAQGMFTGCSSLEVIVMPKVRAVAYQCTHNCGNLQVVDIGKTAASAGTGIIANAFGTCAKLNTLILRRSTVIALANVNAFSVTAFKSGGTGGTLYVPQSLLSSYQSASGWSTLLGYANNQILPIEGSIYENTYADGTPI